MRCIGGIKLFGQEEIIKTILNVNHGTTITGGFLRDFFAGESTFKDIDIVIEDKKKFYQLFFELSKFGSIKTTKDFFKAFSDQEGSPTVCDKYPLKCIKIELMTDYGITKMDFLVGRLESYAEVLDFNCNGLALNWQGLNTVRGNALELPIFLEQIKAKIAIPFGYAAVSEERIKKMQEKGWIMPLSSTEDVPF